VSCGKDQEQAWIVVQDDGSGFTPEALEGGLKPFFTTREGGTGLGLSIAFQVADQHGGDLVIGNRQEGGAQVRITIPAQGIAGR
jgi:signal transduction histidine kinase